MLESKEKSHHQLPLPLPKSKDGDPDDMEEEEEEEEEAPTGGYQSEDNSEDDLPYSLQQEFSRLSVRQDELAH